ncbi:hypothetical protein MSZK_40950 [Mycobacterium sp. shizuoka-1]|nr:hypothetical protein MSZK_40950 [Mycobacterium sp. shizuoka-1]
MAPITSVIVRFGGVAGESAAVDDATATVDLADPAVPDCWIGGTESVVVVWFSSAAAAAGRAPTARAEPVALGLVDDRGVFTRSGASA